jgi:AcrR family transcriptional regulator
MTVEKELNPKTRAKRDAILANSLKLFAKEGFHNADVQVIADLSKVGKGTVYRHFGNKQQLFLATSKYCLESLREFVERKVGDEAKVRQLVIDGGLPALLRKIAISCAEFYQKRPQAVEIMIQERAEFRESVYPSHLMFRAENRDVLAELMQAAMDNGELRKVDVQLAHSAYGDLVFGSVINGCLEGAKTQLVKRVEVAIDLFLLGFVIQNKGSSS